MISVMYIGDAGLSFTESIRKQVRQVVHLTLHSQACAKLELIAIGKIILIWLASIYYFLFLLPIPCFGHGVEP